MKREGLWQLLRPHGRQERTMNMIGVVLLLIIGQNVAVVAGEPLSGTGGGQHSNCREVPLEATGTDRQPTGDWEPAHSEPVANQQRAWGEPAANPVRPCNQRGASPQGSCIQGAANRQGTSSERWTCGREWAFIGPHGAALSVMGTDERTRNRIARPFPLGFSSPRLCFPLQLLLWTEVMLRLFC